MVWELCPLLEIYQHFFMTGKCTVIKTIFFSCECFVLIHRWRIAPDFIDMHGITKENHKY